MRQKTSCSVLLWIPLKRADCAATNRVQANQVRLLTRSQSNTAAETHGSASVTQHEKSGALVQRGQTSAKPTLKGEFAQKFAHFLLTPMSMEYGIYGIYI